ncbi:hypothetical protein LQR31_08140 [Chromobacterium vaccinii]|uniref:hypothetical protein n=1 Tax=Chromobacterium vaccinii TaxID=1108595 RepID=UPI001E54B675|nr:hypothetical protein [Chromobacterium vaccinii]MCD4484439.1 hypothetical protein [Chromobacterium vaccinii]
MKKALTAILALLPTLALAAPAASAPHGRDPARFGEMKAKQLQMLSQHIQVLQSAQRCVQAAQTPQALQSCREALRQQVETMRPGH